MTDQPSCRAFITGVQGFTWTDEEIDFITQFKPWGLILFKRNIDTPHQVKDLIAQFRHMVARPNAPVLIDQEGGRVQRLGPPHWPVYPAAAWFESLPHKTRAEKYQLAEKAALLMAHDLHELGINVDCLPVLDVPARDGHDVIGNRAYSDDPTLVAQYGQHVLSGLEAGGVLGVIKHIPGHGRARADSHKELPIVTASRDELERIDFQPFVALAAQAPMAMTAHVVYTALDPHAPATTSPLIVHEIIRHHIGFDGLLMSDDLSMKALSGSFADRTKAVFAAGVDIALHCNGDLSESREVAAASPLLAGKYLARAMSALARLKALVAPAQNHMKLVEARAEIDLVIAQAGDRGQSPP
jgi:beta-N-acetylhexosaminidase